MSKKEAREKTVLVGVLKSRRDLEILLKEHWYRIPKKHLPKGKFKYLAFYQPALFGRSGKRIIYYARVLSSRTARREDLLPNESGHPRAKDDYVRIRVGKLNKLARPIKNASPRRVSFGFTTLLCLLRAQNILQLYDVAETEEMVKNKLRGAGVKAIPQYWVNDAKKRYRLDFAIFCKQGKIAIECDNLKAHSGTRQRQRDNEKDEFLKEGSWDVLRFKEDDIVSRADMCLKKVIRLVKRRGGLC